MVSHAEPAGWSLPLPRERAATWRDAAGKAVTLGIRPEHVAPGKGGLPMAVVLVEPLGSDCLLSLERDGWQLAARVAGLPPVGNGDVLEVTLDMNRCHLFDRASGLAL